jgi:DnaK suppressor protein
MMLQLDFEKYRQMLLQKRAELEGNVRQRDGLAIEKRPDLLDEVQLAAERELVVISRDIESSLLREVRAALERSKDGSFGLCLRCEEPIAPRRLNAVPWASHCISCQEAIEQERGRHAGGAGVSEEDEFQLPRAA